jgi:hypothetical protein
LRSCQLRTYSRTSQHFTEPEGSLPCSQESSTVPVLSQNNIVHTTPSYLFKIHFNIVACRLVAGQRTRNKRDKQSLLGSHQRSSGLPEWRSRGNPNRHECNNGTSTEKRYFLLGPCKGVIRRPTEARIVRKCKRLRHGGGQAYDRSSD